MSDKKVSAGVARICTAHREHLDVNARDGMLAVAKAATANKVTEYDQAEAVAYYTSKVGGGYTESSAKSMASIDALIVYHCRDGSIKRLEKILECAEKLPTNKRFSSRDIQNNTTAMRRVRDAEYIDEKGKPIPPMKRAQYEPATLAASEIPATIEDATKATARATAAASANREATTERKALEAAMAFINRCKFGANETKGRDAVVSKLTTRIEKLKAE